MRRIALLVVVAGALAAPSVAGAEVVWLCGPAAGEPDPCRLPLTTTVYTPDGQSSVVDRPLPADPPVDCFYVYPTVSEQRSRNANKDKDPEIVAVAKHQAARYSQTCRVYAPVYRQQTLGGLTFGGSEESLAIAYSDVEEAWREYLARYNNGRGVVLIGHSQGTRMLRQLLRKAIEPDAAAHARLVSALLLGGNVTVRKGEIAGGDFQRTPGCTQRDQTGCVIAFSTYNETPPSNSRYGRPPSEDTSGFGFPAGPDYEILCTNPVNLGANQRTTLGTLVHGEPFPGIIGLLLVLMYGGPQPSADTAWLRPQDHYTGACETRNGANVLMIEPVGDARRLNPSPEPSWGLHLADANIALGDLVAIVERQAAAHLARRQPAARLRLRQRRRRGRGRGCIVRVSGMDRGAVRSVLFRVGKRRVRDRRPPFRIRARGRVRAVAVLYDGRRVKLRTRCR